MWACLPKFDTDISVWRRILSPGFNTVILHHGIASGSSGYYHLVHTHLPTIARDPFRANRRYHLSILVRTGGCVRSTTRALPHHKPRSRGCSAFSSIVRIISKSCRMTDRVCALQSNANQRLDVSQCLQRIKSRIVIAHRIPLPLLFRRLHPPASASSRRRDAGKHGLLRGTHRSNSGFGWPGTRRWLSSIRKGADYFRPLYSLLMN